MRACLFAFYLFCHPQPAPAMLTLTQSALVAADLRQTARNREAYGTGFQELNPLARPIVNAGPAAMAVAGYAEVAGTAWLAQRLRRSGNRVARRIWWLPQALGIAGHAWGLAVSR